jgi:hypothetical protein
LPDFIKAVNLSTFTRPENWSVLPDFTNVENWSVLADFTKPANLSDFTRAENWSVLPQIFSARVPKLFLVLAGYVSRYEK